MLTRAKLSAIAIVAMLGSAHSAFAATVDMKPVSHTDPWMVVPLPAGNIAYTNQEGGMTLATPDGVAFSFVFGLGPSPGAVSDLTGGIWASGKNTDQPLAHVDAEGSITFTSAFPSGTVASELTWGPDNALWFTEYTTFPHAAVDKIGRRAANGTVTEFGGLTPGAKPSTIISGPEGNLWFEEPGINGIGRISTHGATTEFPLPPGVTLAGGRGREMAFGPGGDLYFIVAGGIARMTESGIVTGVITGGLSDFAPNAVAYGGDGNLWATECAANTVTRISPSGVVTRSPEGTFPPKACPMGMVAGSDGVPWLYEWNTGRAGRLLFSKPLATTDDPTDVASTAAALNGTASPRGVATKIHFEYGTTTAYGHVTAEQSIGDGEETVSVTATPTGLAASTTYHYRLVATSVIGTVEGADTTVTTRPTPPVPAPPLPADTDADGFNVLVDCDDLSAAIHPGAYDRAGDGVDEDCSGADASYQRFQPHAEAGWKTSHGRISFTKLLIDEMPAGSSLKLSCTGPGCKISDYSANVSKPVKRLDLASRLKKAKLRKGAVVQLVLSRPGFITTVVRWTIGPPPRATILCVPPGAKKPKRC